MMNIYASGSEMSIDPSLSIMAPGRTSNDPSAVDQEDDASIPAIGKRSLSAWNWIKMPQKRPAGMHDASIDSRRQQQARPGVVEAQRSKWPNGQVVFCCSLHCVQQ